MLFNALHVALDQLQMYFYVPLCAHVIENVLRKYFSVYFFHISFSFSFFLSPLIHSPCVHLCLSCAWLSPSTPSPLLYPFTHLYSSPFAILCSSLPSPMHRWSRRKAPCSPLVVIPSAWMTRWRRRGSSAPMPAEEEEQLRPHPPPLECHDTAPGCRGAKSRPACPRWLLSRGCDGAEQLLCVPPAQIRQRSRRVGSYNGPSVRSQREARGKRQ